MGNDPTSCVTAIVIAALDKSGIMLCYQKVQDLFESGAEAQKGAAQLFFVSAA